MPLYGIIIMQAKSISSFMLRMLNLFFKQTCVTAVHDGAPEDVQFDALNCKFYICIP